MGGAGPLQDGDHLGLAHAVSQLFIAGRVEQHRPHHPDLVALHVPVVVHHVLDHAGGGAQDDHDHVGVFGAVAVHHLEVGAQDLVHIVHGNHEAPPEKAVRQVLGHLAFHGQVRVGEGAGEGAVLEVGLVHPVGRPHVILQEGVGELLKVFDGVALDETVADDHGGQHHLLELADLEGHGQQVVQFLVVLAHQLGPAGIAHRVEVGVAAVDAQRALVDLPGHDRHHHRQALARHGKEVLGLEQQALGRGVVGIAPALAGHGLHRGDGREFVGGLEIHELVAEEVLLAVGRHPGEGFGNGGGRGDGVAAETVHQAGQHRNGRLVAIHQDVLPFAHILEQRWGDGGQIKGKEFVGVKALPFGGPVDGQHFGLLGLPQPVVGELLAQGIDFGAGSHVGYSP